MDDRLSFVKAKQKQQQQPDSCSDEADFHAGIFALFRHFENLITQPVPKQNGNSKVFAEIDDDPHTLPKVWIMREAKPDTKLWRNLQVLEPNPLMLHQTNPA